MVSGSHSALTTARFVRLTGLSISYLCIGIPLAFVSAVTYLRTAGRYSDYSWVYMHSAVSSVPLFSFAHVDTEPMPQWSKFTVIIKDDKPYYADFSNWSNVIVAAFFFAAFGFGAESTALLKRVGQPFRRCASRPRGDATERFSGEATKQDRCVGRTISQAAFADDTLSDPLATSPELQRGLSDSCEARHSPATRHHMRLGEMSDSVVASRYS